MSPPVLLTDDLVQRFIADGFIELQSDMDEEFHATVTEELSFALKQESRWLGDNLVPRIPVLEELLHSPILDGALRSLLGPDFAWAPHRFPHNSEPISETSSDGDFNPFQNGPKMGEGSISGSGWHQDGHSKSGRSRWHTFRAINVFYFPHDTPLEMGPTRLLAGSHLYATLREVVPEQVVFKPMKAGTIIVADFDLGHAGSPNRTEQSRYMLKFVALRMRNPESPSWNHQREAWSTPDRLKTPDYLPTAWMSLWNWICGKSRQTGLNTCEKGDVQANLDALASKCHADRLEAMYRLTTVGTESIPRLVAHLCETADENRHVSPDVHDPGYAALSEDPLERKFSQRQFVPEDTAIVLGAIGLPALPELVELLEHEDPWIRINSAYAISEMGNQVPQEITEKVAELLDSPLHCEVRATLDAMCSLTNFSAETVKKIRNLLTESSEEWQFAAMGEKKLGGTWTLQNQIRYVAAWALRARIAADDVPAETEAALIAALDENTGYTPAVACDALTLIGTNSALSASVRYLRTRRWDPASFAHRARKSTSLKVA